MQMYEVFNFVMAIPPADRPENLAQILFNISGKLAPDSFFLVRGIDGEIYANCGGRLLQISDESFDKDYLDSLPESDTKLWFEIYADQLDNVSIELQGTIQVNLLCQQLLELDAERALPIVEAKLKEIAGKDFQIHCMKTWSPPTKKIHTIYENATYRIFFRGSITTLKRPELKIEVVTGIRPELFDEEKHVSHKTLVKPTEKYCLEFLLNALM